MRSPRRHRAPELGGPVAKNISDEERSGLAARHGISSTVWWPRLGELPVTDLVLQDTDAPLMFVSVAELTAAAGHYVTLAKALGFPYEVLPIADAALQKLIARPGMKVAACNLAGGKHA